MASQEGTAKPQPRRPPAHKSVSLRRSSPEDKLDAAAILQAKPEERISTVPSSNRANPPSSGHSKHSKNSSLLQGLPDGRSGESSNAEHWFEKSNNRIQPGSGINPDGEPPFYLRNPSSSSGTPPDIINARAAMLRAAGLNIMDLQATSLGQTGSGSEEFRSIVDDLTVENKKLKHKLRKYEKMYDAHLQQEKLFEIKVHGLSAKKKRELEETLRTFAMSLEKSPKATATDSTHDSSTPALQTHLTKSSSHTSTKFADSAYVSNSASEKTPSAGLGVEPPQKSKASKSSAAQRREDIHSYLHDIPVGLMPKQPVVMTEKSKQKLVVRRLEQIFAGKGAAVGGHQHPQQQQEVSQSAAHADRMAIEAAGQVPQAEGLREAQFFPPLSGKVANIGEAAAERDVDNKAKLEAPEQRPTRPLDLDLHRAQVPQDNIEYIRHLGFSPADFGAQLKLNDDHGWIYLNVLTNMAQLHTLNVTNEFVIKAISDYSQKMTISKDGRKVRWKGGRDVTQTSSNGSPHNSSDQHLPGRRKKGSRHVGKSTPSGHSTTPSKTSGTHSGSNNKLAYVPLFYRKQSTESNDTSDDNTSSWKSPTQEYATGVSSGLASSGMNTSSSKRKRDNDGPIIFYSKAKFCTDLSGDRDNSRIELPQHIKYHTAAGIPVGAGPLDDEVVLDRRPVVRASVAEDFVEIDDVRSQLSDDVNISPIGGTFAAAGRQSSPPIDFEVSGLGGVQPDDNFQIYVRSEQVVTGTQPSSRATHFSNLRRQSLSALQLSKPTRTRTSSGLRDPPIRQSVLAVRRKQLQPSALPEPASLFTFSSPEDGDSADEGGDDADSDISSVSGDGYLPDAMPQPLNNLDGSGYEDESDDGYESDGAGMDMEEDDEDDEVDLLAFARELDPVLVHEREREYNADLAERIAEEIPAGSSAATAGGGSGNSSPVGEHGVSVASGKRRSAGRSPEGVAGLKRVRSGVKEEREAKLAKVEE